MFDEYDDDNDDEYSYDDAWYFDFANYISIENNRTFRQIPSDKWSSCPVL